MTDIHFQKDEDDCRGMYRERKSVVAYTVAFTMNGVCET